MKKGEFLLNIRKKHKASRAKFAELLEVSPSTIEKTEKELVPVTPENKYVKAVCALEGLDNEIFKFDEITDEILKEYELTKFSKAFRKFLYFYYGDFWNEKIKQDMEEKIIKTLDNYLIKINLDVNDEISELIEYSYLIKNILKLQKIHQIQYEINTINFFLEQVILIVILYESYNFPINIEDFVDMPIKVIKEYFFDKKIFISKQNNLQYLFKLNVQLILQKIDNIFSLQKPLTIENIKRLRERKKLLEKIKDEVISAPTDPKDKQICELLQYAPPAFKDKIVEKLLKFKDEVEDI